MSKPDLASQLKNVSAKDLKQIENAQEMLGPDPETMGFIKNIFWGNLREDMIFPYPEEPADERTRCDKLLEELGTYFKTEHPSVEIDQKQEIPEWVISRLFELGVCGMIVPKKYGGQGFGVTSYNRVLELIGRNCGSTAVMISAHLSIGCNAITLFGSEEQKLHWLPKISNEALSAFCLSEPNVGCDAQGQETTCELTECGQYYIINGEKKWATSAAYSCMFTVMAKYKMTDPKTGKTKEKFNAVIVSPDMEGVDIFSRNRSKCGIRGTWQGRVRFTNVKVPRENLLHEEGKGIVVALTCLNWGRCTLAAGMVGAGAKAYEQSMKWAQYRHQFDRPIAEFELMKERIARMGAFVWAMDAMLYATTGMVDRNDEDIMLETAVCKVFCSEYGFRCTNEAMQIMGGEGYMTENELERLWRDSRINPIVEGANEVMHSFIFAYGSKQMGEFMLGVKAAPFKNMGAALKIGMELFLGIRRSAPKITMVDPALRTHTQSLANHIREFSHQVKLMFKEKEEALISNQTTQCRLSWIAIWIHAMSCSISKMDKSIRNDDATQIAHDSAMLDYIMEYGAYKIQGWMRALRQNPDKTMLHAAEEALKFSDTLPNSDYYIPERTPDLTARGNGKPCDTESITQFGSGSLYAQEETSTH
ncbi:MAG: acyl-CoA dehydrogenase family protein [Phycisphaerales bacterium]|nr:acyl-CoA dehydrogenase family protein [Phycisphaerales bacterium]